MLPIPPGTSSTPRPTLISSFPYKFLKNVPIRVSTFAHKQRLHHTLFHQTANALPRFSITAHSTTRFLYVWTLVPSALTEQRLESINLHMTVINILPFTTLVLSTIKVAHKPRKTTAHLYSCRCISAASRPFLRVSCQTLIKSFRWSVSARQCTCRWRSGEEQQAGYLLCRFLLYCNFISIRLISRFLCEMDFEPSTAEDRNALLSSMLLYLDSNICKQYLKNCLEE